MKTNTEEGEESGQLSALVVSSEAKNDILQFAGKEFASEPLISSSILSIWSKVKTPKLKTF